MNALEASMSQKSGIMTRQAGTEVADGVYWFAADAVNWYVISSDDELTIVDAGLPSHWELLRDGLDELGYDLTDVRALVLTHTDVDHIGFAEQLRKRGVPIWVHVDEFDDALAGGRDMPPRVLFHLWRPPVIRMMIAQMRAGAFSAPPITDARTFEDGQELDVPGRPEVIHVPGHTVGQSSFWIPDRNVLFVGDSLLTADPLTGKACDPRVGGFSEADVDRAKQSTRLFTEFEDVTVLPGHGSPWNGHLGNALAAQFSARPSTPS